MTSFSSRSTVAHLPPPAYGMRLRMSYEEYLAWAPETMFAEWKDGEVVVAMPVLEIHQRVLDLLHLLLGMFVRVRALGVVRTAPMVVKLWPGEGPAREPDLFFVSAAQQEHLGPDLFAGGPALVVEIISEDSTKRDRETKREEYPQAGVGEYWVIDPRPDVRRQPSVTVYRLAADGQYDATTVVQEGVVRSSVVSGFWVRVEWLWARPDPDPMTLLHMILRYPEGPDAPEAQEGLAALPWAGPLLRQGRDEGKRDSLRAIVRARFAAVPPDLEQRIASADAETIEAMIDRAAIAPRVEEI
jgi:Uma2 family endonuclease